MLRRLLVFIFVGGFVCVASTASAATPTRAINLLDDIESKIALVNPSTESCVAQSDAWVWTRSDLRVGAEVSFGIHDILELGVSAEVEFVWVRMGHEPD